MDILVTGLILIVMVLIAINVYLYCRMMRYYKLAKKASGALTTLIWNKARKKQI